MKKIPRFTNKLVLILFFMGNEHQRKSFGESTYTKDLIERSTLHAMIDVINENNA